MIMLIINRLINKFEVYECMKKNVCKNYVKNLFESYIEKLLF